MTSVERAAALEEDEALAVSHNDMARQVTPAFDEQHRRSAFAKESPRLAAL
jgi:hypothetical protein